MMRPRLLLFFVLAAFVGTPLCPAREPARPRPPAAEKKVRAPEVVRWRSANRSRPCDSASCREVKFAWSPTAPGS